VKNQELIKTLIIYAIKDYPFSDERQLSIKINRT